MRDGADGGSRQPGQAKEGTDAAHGHDEQQVQVEAGALDHLALWFADDQPGGVGGQGLPGLFFAPTPFAPSFLPQTWGP